MFGNYWTITLRSIMKNKGYTFINIAGLSLGMLCCIILFSFVLSELSYDKYHANADNIYRIGITADFGGQSVNLPIFNAPAPQALIKDFPEIINAVRFDKRPRTPVAIGDKNFYEEGIFYADESIFEQFSFQLQKGDPRTALSQPYTVVITEEMAEKYFGEQEPIGKILRFNDKNDFTVTGVMSNVPKNSHFTFDFLCSFETHYKQNPEAMDVWMRFNYYTYLQLKDGTNPEELEKKFPGFVKTYMEDQLKQMGGSMDFFLQPLTSIHLNSHLNAEISANSSIWYVYIFSVVAILVILIACINFMNLSTARSGERAKEVGIRKVLGASRGKLVKQFLGESIVYSLCALAIALAVSKLILPTFNSMADRDLSGVLLSYGWFIPSLIGLAVLIGLGAGSYPAFFLSSFQPVSVLKGSLKAGTGNAIFRRILVVTQFTISIVLIAGTIIINNQLNFLKTKQLGFTKEQVISLPITDSDVRQKVAAAKEEIKSYSGIIDVALSSHYPGQDPEGWILVPEGFTLEQSQLVTVINIDEDFVATMGLEIVAGRNFSDAMTSDAANSVLINETAAKQYGWDDPVGKTFQSFDGPTLERTRTVVGVVRDFHQESLNQVIAPMVITNDPDNMKSLMVKINVDNSAGALDFLREFWRDIDPGRPFEYNFVDESFDMQFKADERMSRIFSYFTLVTIFVACLGLFGLASFTSEQRTKEIGIRKVLGSSNTRIFMLLNKEVAALLVIANIVAIPVAYFSIDYWLRSFAYQTEPGVLPFAASTALVFFIAFATVSYKSVKAAFANPVDAIRSDR